MIFLKYNGYENVIIKNANITICIFYCKYLILFFQESNISLGICIFPCPIPISTSGLIVP